MRKCPCKDCLMVARCKNKGFLELVQGCTLVVDYLYCRHIPEYSYRRKGFDIDVQRVIKALQTKSWYIDSITSIHSVEERR